MDEQARAKVKSELIAARHRLGTPCGLTSLLIGRHHVFTVMEIDVGPSAANVNGEILVCLAQSCFPVDASIAITKRGSSFQNIPRATA